MAAISSRETLGAVGLVADGAPVTAGRVAGGGGMAATCWVATAGRLLATGRVSNAMRLMSIKCNGETLSEVMDINQNDFAKLRPRQRGAVTIDAYPDRQYEGVIEEISPEANRQKATVQV